jgi:hypothetical protein
MANACLEIRALNTFALAILGRAFSDKAKPGTHNSYEATCMLFIRDLIQQPKADRRLVILFMSKIVHGKSAWGFALV